jgi:hypothetical protein
MKPSEAKKANEKERLAGSTARYLPMMYDPNDNSLTPYDKELDKATVTAYLPKVSTDEGKKIAEKWALKLANGEVTQNQIPYKYRGYASGLNSGYKVSNAISDFGNKFAPVLAGSFLAGPLITYGIAAYSNPLIRTALDTIGSIDGIRNVFTDNGISKTIRLAKKGDT